MSEAIQEENLIFLFSLPRSGSTLLQRILASHPKICTCSEPWVLLPLLYSLKLYGSHSEYNQSLSFRAIQEFISNMPEGEADYNEVMKHFVLSLYNKVMTSGTEYFLDKTPRYYLILPQIAKIFPKAKFIFLFRQPLHVLSSIMSTWFSGRFRFENNYIDLFEGPQMLADGFRLLKDNSIWLDFEDLVKEPIASMDKISDYLGMEFEDSIINSFHNIELMGQMGDPTGVNDYKNIDMRPLEKWKSVLNTKYRKKYAIKYLSHIGEDNLKTFGYDFAELKQEVEQIKSQRGGGLRDRVDVFVCLLFRIFEVPLFRRNRRERISSGKTFVLHR